MANLMDGLLEELRRNRELAAIYDTIPTGAIGAALIRRDIATAEKAIAESDTVAMLRVYNALKNNE